MQTKNHETHRNTLRHTTLHCKTHLYADKKSRDTPQHTATRSREGVHVIIVYESCHVHERKRDWEIIDRWRRTDKREGGETERERPRQTTDLNSAVAQNRKISRSSFLKRLKISSSCKIGKQKTRTDKRDRETHRQRGRGRETNGRGSIRIRQLCRCWSTQLGTPTSSAPHPHPPPPTRLCICRKRLLGRGCVEKIGAVVWDFVCIGVFVCVCV